MPQHSLGTLTKLSVWSLLMVMCFFWKEFPDVIHGRPFIYSMEYWIPLWGGVSNGVVGSLAFAAFDQGYDVFLGIFVAWFLGNMLTREFLQESTGHTPSMNTGLGIYLHGLHVSEAIHVLKHELNLLRSTTRSADQA